MKRILRKISLALIGFILSGMNLIAHAAENPCGEGDISVELNEPIGNCGIIASDSAIGFIQQYISIMYVYAASTVGIICVLVIAISGMQYGMDSESAETAKKRITNSIQGLSLLFASALILYVINPEFFTF